MPDITLTSADGSEHSCRILEIFELDGREYALLLKLAGDSGEEESTVLMQLRHKEGEAVFRTIEDDAEFERVTAYIRELAGDSPRGRMHNPRLSEKWLETDNPCTLTFPIARFASLREWRLALVAFYRRVPAWQQDDRIYDGIALVERLAEGAAGEEQRLAALADAVTLKKCWPLKVALEGSENVEELVEAADAAAHASGNGKSESRAQCDIIRDILGNPFRLVTVNGKWPEFDGGAVVKLAAKIYAEESFHEVPQLGNLLRGAGCTNQAVLDHCREGALHVRGCWLLDGLLDKRKQPEAEIIEPRSADDWLADD